MQGIGGRYTYFYYYLYLKNLKKSNKHRFPKNIINEFTSGTVELGKLFEKHVTTNV